MTNNILNLRTYGKASLYNRIKEQVVYRFKINPHAENHLRRMGLRGYIPPLNRGRFCLSVVVTIGLIIIPFVTPLSIPVVLWGIR